jgi:hypothetical protein
MWTERAEFDIYRNHVTGSTPHRRHLYDRSTNHFSCIFCQTPLELHQGNSSQTPTSTSITTTPIKAHTRQSIATRSSSSSSATYPPPPNSDMV